MTAIKKPPQTSIEAFRSLKASEIKKTYEGILSALRIITEGTFEDISKEMKCKPDKIWKRLSELDEKYNLIFRPGHKKVLKSSRQGYVWRLTEDGENSVSFVEKSMPGKTVSQYSKDILSHTQKLF